MGLRDQLSDPAAERGILAGIVAYGKDAFVDVEDIIDESTFTIDSNQLIFKCLKEIFRGDHTASVDLAMIYGAASDLKITHILEQKEERAHLRAIQNLQVNLDNVRKFAQKIKKLEIARTYYDAHHSAAKSISQLTGTETIDHIIAASEAPIYDVTSRLSDTSKAVVSMGDDLDAYLDHIESNPCETVGISTGYKIFDIAIGGGLRRKTINVIGARPKTGKTQLADNIGFFIASKLNIPVLNLDTEMSKTDHWNRILANLSGVEVDDIETGRYGKIPNKKMKVRAAAEKMKSSPYDYACIAGKPFEETISLVRRWVLKKVGKDEYGNTKDCVIVLDYLKMMDISDLKSLQEYQILGFQMTALHNLCVQLDIPCLLFIQLNRDGITKESTDAASGSDRIIWLCSNFSIYKIKSDEEIQEDGLEEGNRKLVTLALRHGAGLQDGDWINMKFQGKYGRIVEGRTHLDIIHNKNKKEFEVTDDDGGDTEF